MWDEVGSFYLKKAMESPEVMDASFSVSIMDIVLFSEITLLGSATLIFLLLTSMTLFLEEDCSRTRPSIELRSFYLTSDLGEPSYQALNVFILYPYLVRNFTCLFAF